MNKTLIRRVCRMWALGIATGCGGATGSARAPTSSAVVTPEAALASCGQARAGTRAARPVAPPRTGSTVALATIEGKTLAFAADEDDWAVHTVDVDSGRAVGTTVLDGRPSQLMFLPDGRLVVLLRDKSQVQVMEPAPAQGQLETRCVIEASAEPVGLALSPDDRTLLVTSGWGRVLTAFDGRTLSKQFEVALAREPRAVVVSDDGAFAYVSHAVGGRGSKVDLRTKTVHEISLHASDAERRSQLKQLRAQLDAAEQSKDPDADDIRGEFRRIENSQPSCQGYALAKSIDPPGRLFAPQVLIDTGDLAEHVQGYGNDEAATEVPDIAVIDARSGAPMAASLERDADAIAATAPECLLPRAAVFEPTRKSLLVSCLGIDEVIEYDAQAASPVRAERNRWTVAAGPNGIAVDPTKNRAVVWSQFERTLNILELGRGELVDDEGRSPVESVRVRPPPDAARALPMQVALGRILFHSVGDPRISRDGRACASCHPDGRDDSLVWATPEGLRRSIMLAGRVESTAPYAWSGNHEDLKAHLVTTFDRLNGAGGLKGFELDALVAYVQSLPPPPAREATHDPRVAKGAQLFASPEVGCSGCHKGGAGTDGELHDVQSRGKSDTGESFNTPSLRFVGGTGPYFHDGRYQTLHDLLASNGERMGRTKQLSAEDLDALEAYLRTR